PLRRHRRQELFPLGRRPLYPAHHPRGAVRLLRTDAQAPAHLARRAVALVVVAAQAAGDQVLPRVLSAPRARQHVIDRGRILAAVSAALIIAPQHTTPAHWDTP